MKRPTHSHLTRRDFLKIGGLALTGLAAAPLWTPLSALDQDGPVSPLWTRPPERDHGKLVRVATRQVDIRSQPNDEARIVGNRFRDQLLHVYAEVNPPDAPQFYNTLWYRVWGGYVHSAHLQEVKIQINEPLPGSPPESGLLTEVSVPYTVSYQYNERNGWYPWRGSRLYYSSTHWITGLDEGPDGEPWYQVTSELSATEVYWVPARHMRIIPPDELRPISPEVPPEAKRIEISLPEQTLRAYEYDELVYTARISSGIPGRTPPGELPTATPKGRFRIYSKMPSKHMGSIAGGDEVESNGGFSLPGVPWTMFFEFPGGYALHGTYWHNNFGLQMSHGCVNMRNEDAKWLFRWTTPVFAEEINDHSDWERRGNGTLVIIS